MPASGGVSIHYRKPISLRLPELGIDKITCVFVHGWAMNAAIWESCAHLMPDWLDAVFIDLPGHGNMNDAHVASIDDMVEVVSAVSARPALFVGWSLGGLVCQKLAQVHPQKVIALYLVASTPRFVQSEQWSAAVSSEVFENFAELFSRDIDKTIKRFIALQLMGSEGARELMLQIDAAMTSRGAAATDALQVGLDILRHTDLRESLVQIDKPIGCFLGSNDMLIPADVADALTSLRPDIDVVVQQDAGHAPFLSHPQQFVDALTGFIDTRVAA